MVTGLNIALWRLKRLVNKRVLQIALISIFLVTLLYQFNKNTLIQSSTFIDYTKTSNEWTTEQIHDQPNDIFTLSEFNHKLFSILKEFKPVEPPQNESLFIDKEKCKKGEHTVNDNKGLETLSYNSLNACFNLTPEYKQNLKEMHQNFVEAIKKIPKNLPDTLFNKDKGIVTVGGGKYSIILVTMLPMLRMSGNTLPVEIFIPKSDEKYDKDFCENFVPQYNATCIYMSKFLTDDVVQGVNISGYQYKLLALLLSDFKNILFLDSDNYVLTNVDDIFDKDVYEETGLILWPDLWRRQTSPDWYDIAGLEYNLTQRVRFSLDDLTPSSQYINPEKNTLEYIKENIPFHDLKGTLPDLSSESGQLLINKVDHFDTLLLALYYNIYGPSWYYTLFSEHGSGQGDKETFIAAAFALHKPYYQVKTPITFSSHFSNGFKGVGLLQHDYAQDYELYQLAKKQVQLDHQSYSEYDPQYSVEKSYVDKFFKTNKYGNDRCDVLFIHASFSKFNPYDLYHNKDFLDSEGKHLRGFSNTHLFHNLSEFELINFKQIKKIFCDTEVFKFPFLDMKYEVAGKKNGHSTETEKQNNCKYIHDHFAYLESNPIKKKL